MAKTICIFAAQYLPHMGGVENYTYNLSKHLVQMGHKVIIVTSNVQRLPNYEIMEDIPVYRLPCINLLEGRYPVLKFNKEFFSLNKVLNSYNFDFVIINTRFYIHSLYGAVFAKMKRIKSIVIEHGTSHLTIHNKFWDTVGQIYEHTLTKVVKLFCKNYYGVSEVCNEWLKHFNINAVGTLHNAIDLKRINEIYANTIIDYREMYDIPKNAKVITFTGRLLKEKGLLQLIEVIKKINEEYDNVYLFIAGEGDLKEQIDILKNEKIIPLGRLSFENIIALLKSSDIFCLPSDSEGFSTSVLEAAACHTYIITTKRGGASELIKNERYGAIIDDNDFNSIYNVIKSTLLEFDKIRETSVELSYEQLANNFTWEIVSKKVELISEEVN